MWQRHRDIDYGTMDGDLKKAFSTPTIIDIGKEAQLISPAAMATFAYDPLTGRELWRVQHGGMNVASRPLFGMGMVFINPGDGAPARLIAVKPDGHGDLSNDHVVWKYGRGVPTRSSLLLVDGLVYMANESGVATCLDARSGRLVWQKRLGREYSSSPIYADGRIYFMSQEGATHVIKPGKEGKILSVNQLDEGCMASPAAVGQALFIRTKSHLYRIEEAKRGN
jgi:outer membrane protein assembly factor BamB